MKFTPKTENEVSSYGLLQPGTYEFEIAKAEDKVSKAGNEMIKIVMKVFDKDGSTVIVSDYLLTDEAMAFKLRHCCSAIGILNKYETGELVAGDFVSGMGQVKVKINKGKPKEDGSGEFYSDSNGIVDYVKRDGLTAAQAKAHGIVKDELDDSIPF